MLMIVFFFFINIVLVWNIFMNKLSQIFNQKYLHVDIGC